MSKLLDDLKNQVEPGENIVESVASLMEAIADRIEGCHGDKVKLSDLVTVLREDPKDVGKAVVANTPAAEKTRTTSYDAPSPVFEKPRDNVRTAEQARDEEKRERKAAKAA